MRRSQICIVEYAKRIMLRITFNTAFNHPNPAMTLSLEGQIVGVWVKELELACARARADGSPITLDLAGVSFIDHDGLEMLRRLQGVTLANPSAFVAELLKGVEQ